MKLKYILGVVLSAFLIMGCSDDDDTLGMFGDISVNQSYLSIDENGGDAKVTVKAQKDWAFDKIFQTITKNNDGTRDTTYNALPNWLTADVVSGGAGETVVTFHADATSGGREAELQIVSGNHTVFLLVRQGSMEAASATCAEVIAGADGKTFRVKGTVTKIANTTYGNWYLNDGTGEIYIYGTLDAEGKTKNFSSLGLEEGDVVEVEGPKTTYNGTVELVDVTVLNITKSLLKVVTEPQTVSKDGGNISVKVGFKGNGAYVNIPEADADWVKYLGSEQAAADTVIFRFNIAANEGEGRETTLVFSSANAEASSEISYTIKQETAIANPAKGSGTKADPFNVTAALAYTRALGDDVKSENDVYVTGIVSSVKYTYSAQFGTATYNISVDGNEDNVFTVYGSYYFDNKPWEEGNTQIAVGDVVVVCGKVINYKGTTPEFASKENWLVKLNGASGGSGDTAEPGTLDNPFTPAQALEEAGKLENKTKSESDYYIKGKISSIKYTFSAQYGTAQFNISEDGATTGDQFLVYGTYYLGNRAWAEGDTQIAVGDEVIICGKLTNYNGTLETANKENYIYSLNGKTE